MSNDSQMLLLLSFQGANYKYNLLDDTLYVDRIEDSQPLYKVTPNTCVYRYQDDQWVKLGLVYLSSLGDRLEFSSLVSPHQNVVVEYVPSKATITYVQQNAEGSFSEQQVIIQGAWIERMVYNDGPYLALETVLIHHWLQREAQTTQAA